MSLPLVQTLLSESTSSWPESFARWASLAQRVASAHANMAKVLTKFWPEFCEVASQFTDNLDQSGISSPFGGYGDGDVSFNIRDENLPSNEEIAEKCKPFMVKVKRYNPKWVSVKLISPEVMAACEAMEKAERAQSNGTSDWPYKDHD